MITLEDCDKIAVNNHNKFKWLKQPIKRQRWVLKQQVPITI